MELKEALIQYRDYTISLIDVTEKEEYNLIEELLNKREEIINIMKDINYTTSEFKDIVNEFNIMSLEEKLNDIMFRKKADIRTKLDKLAKGINANTKYNKIGYERSLYFNEKI